MKNFISVLVLASSLSTMASVKDVGVLGPDGEVILFYKQGSSIIVTSCEPSTILGMTPAEAQKNCQGRSNKVSLESFKRAIRKLVSTDRLNILKPLTAQEVEAYVNGRESSDQIEAMEIELEKINKFIIAYGPKDANLVRREELIKALSSQKTLASAIKKVDAGIEKAVNLIADEAKLTLIKTSLDKEKFLYNVLKPFNPNLNVPCGLEGSIDERINDCSSQFTSSKEGFVLVTRSKDFEEVHKELSTGLLWSDRLPSVSNQYDAEKACKSLLKEFTTSEGLSWRLPSVDEFKEALKSGITTSLTDMDFVFWTSTSTINGKRWVFGGVEEEFTASIPYYPYVSARCVAREK